MLKKLIYQSKLRVTEMDMFLSEFLRIFSLPVDEPEVENQSLLLEDICLANKGKILKEALLAYELCINRVRKMDQTESMTQQDKLRVKQLSGHINYIRSCETDADEAKRTAAVLYFPLLDRYKGFHTKTNKAQSVLIRKYITEVRSEKYAEAFQALELEERTAELESTNELYIQLATECADQEKNMPESPTKVRQRCVEAYRDLVDLINFAQKTNKYYVYDEKIALLSAITQETQELINRRKKGVSEEESTGQEEVTETPAETVEGEA